MAVMLTSIIVDELLELGKRVLERVQAARAAKAAAELAEGEKQVEATDAIVTELTNASNS
jgi:hypothetical protein